MPGTTIYNQHSLTMTFILTMYLNEQCTTWELFLVPICTQNWKGFISRVTFREYEFST